MYYMAEQLMSHNQPFILENNFENATKEGLNKVLDKYSYKTITVTLTGDYRTIYERFVERNIFFRAYTFVSGVSKSLYRDG